MAEVDNVVRQMLAASTPEEIRKARQLQQRWIQRHPKDRYRLLLAGEQLTRMESAMPLPRT